MARKQREFSDCDEMRAMAEEVLVKFQGLLFGLSDSDRIRFAKITSEQAKNSADMCVEEHGKDWIEGASYKYLIASYAEVWDTWSPARQQWEILTSLMALPINTEEKKTRPDVLDHKFILERLGLGWRETNDQGLDLPTLLGDDLSIASEDTSGETKFPD